MAGGTEELKAVIHNLVSFATVDPLEMDPWMRRLVIESEISVDSYTEDLGKRELLHQNQTDKKSRVLALEQELKEIQPKIEHALKKYKNLKKELNCWLSARGISTDKLVA